ncbi:nudix hydrolase [Escherichia phage BF17]|uniref:Nudix hydrolase n=1 Tax=Escherichia phage fEgEco12 TaxID=3158837 RepID=A0AAU7PHE0_9CAUD|nr:nudix hydrolase [Escherichia phage BF17]HCJ9510197.1 NUDIX hydrolase [Escherichia coli]
MNEAVGAIFLSKSTGHMMLNLRSERSTYSNNWAFVGGKLEYNETPLQGLMREIKEELGDSIPTIIDIIPFDVFCTKNGKFKYYSFVIVVENEFVPTLNHESSGYAWVKIGSWPKPLHPGAKNTLLNANLMKDFYSLWESIRQGTQFVNSLPYRY